MLDTRFCLLSNASNVPASYGLKEEGHFTIAIITSDNLTEIQTVTTEALKDIEKNVLFNGSQISAKVFYLENFNASLENSLVKFCDEVISENITSVIITDVLKQGQFHFIPWISSYLGIPVTLMQNTRGFSTKQV